MIQTGPVLSRQAGFNPSGVSIYGSQGQRQGSPGPAGRAGRKAQEEIQSQAPRHSFGDSADDAQRRGPWRVLVAVSAHARQRRGPRAGSGQDGSPRLFGGSGRRLDTGPVRARVRSPGSAGNAADAPRIERQSDLPRSAGLVLPLPPITVNLSDPGGRRYLKLGMEVEVNADVSEALKAQNARIRDAVIMLLAGKSFTDIATPDGKVLLKAEVAARLNQILGAQRVIRVYFTDFVVE